MTPCATLKRREKDPLASDWSSWGEAQLTATWATPAKSTVGWFGASLHSRAPTSWKGKKLVPVTSGAAADQPGGRGDRDGGLGDRSGGW